jgi:hypothetical protein
MMQMFRVIAALLLGLAVMTGPVLAQQQYAEVFRDHNVTVHAGIPGAGGEQKIHFGDLLSMVVQVRYDEDRVRVPAPDSKFFGSAWSEAEGAFFKDVKFSQSTVDGVRQDEYVFSFQLMACPAAQPLCRGDRLYEVPEFNLAYELIDASGAVTSEQTAAFRAGQQKVTISTTLELGEEGELQSFQTYFPNGAFPPPLSGNDSRLMSVGVMVGGLLLLLGGLLMSPFNFFKRKAEVTRINDRWEPLLEQLRTGTYPDDAHQLDAMRRCLVWYCTDKLGVDPFYWVKNEHEVSGDKQKGKGDLAPYRALFNDILLSPRGQGKQLLDRLTQLVKR